MICHSCGKVLDEEVRFCPECGARLQGDSDDQGAEGTGTTAVPADTAGPGERKRITVRLPELDAATEAELAIEQPEVPEAAPLAATTPDAAASDVAANESMPAAPPAPLPPSEVSSESNAPGQKPQNRTLWLIAIGIGCLGLLLIASCLGLVLLFNMAGLLGTTPLLPGPAPTAAIVGGSDAETSSRILLRDDFSNARTSSLGSGDDGKTRYAFVDGGYQIEVVPADMVAWSRIGGSYGDVQIECDATIIEGPADTGVGLIFRYQDADNFYLFTVSGDGFYSLEMIQQGRWQTLIDWTATSALQPTGQPNRLSVATVGDTITLAVNGTVIDETVEPSFAAGEAALAVNTFENGAAVVAFDNLQISRR